MIQELQKYDGGLLHSFIIVLRNKFLLGLVKSSCMKYIPILRITLRILKLFVIFPQKFLFQYKAVCLL